MVWVWSGKILHSWALKQYSSKNSRWERKLVVLWNVVWSHLYWIELFDAKRVDKLGGAIS